MGASLLLKNDVTDITDGVRTVEEREGSVVLATGGSGDVLTGIIAGILVQYGVDCVKHLFDAAVLGVRVHANRRRIVRWRPRKYRNACNRFTCSYSKSDCYTTRMSSTKVSEMTGQGFVARRLFPCQSANWYYAKWRAISKVFTSRCNRRSNRPQVAVRPKYYVGHCINRFCWYRGRAGDVPRKITD